MGIGITRQQLERPFDFLDPRSAFLILVLKTPMGRKNHVFTRAQCVNIQWTAAQD